MTLHRKGDYKNAASVCERYLAKNPNDAQVLHMVGTEYLCSFKTDKAITALRRAARLNKQSADINHDLAMALMADHKLDEAHAVIDKAIRLDPHHALSIGLKAELHRQRGEYEPAYEALKAEVDSGNPGIGTLLAFAKIAPRLDREEEAATKLETCIDGASVAKPALQTAHFYLGTLYDKMKSYDKAFEHFVSASRLTRAPFDMDRFAHAVDLLIEHWTPEVIQSAPRASVTTEAPVFILGMPRSGTSLAEQILSCHPDVYAGGELDYVVRIARQLAGEESAPHGQLHHPELLTQAEVDYAARAYIERIHVSRRSFKRSTDKMPINFLHVGFISLMLPKARIIHCRRSPIDNCLSAFFTQLNWISYPSELADYGTYYGHYKRLMDHWRSVVDVPILDVDYEEMVADQERQSKRLVEFIDLPWNEACLRFYESDRVTFTPSNEQVRQPIYSSSVARYRNYEKHLAPLKRSLEAAGLEVPD
jgi:tetratricopeptide (TPR) repeat protein